MSSNPEIQTSTSVLKSSVRLFLVGSAWQTISMIAARLIPSSLVVILAVFAQPEELGIYSYVTACYTVLALLADLGISYVYPQFIQENPDQTPEIISTALLLRFFLSLALGLLCWTIDSVFSLMQGCGFYVAILLTCSSFGSTVYAFNARFRFKEASSLIISRGFIWLVLAIIFILLGNHVKGPIYALAIAFLFNLILAFYYDGISIWLRFNFELAKEIIKYGFLAMAASTLLIFTSQCGTLMLAYLVNNSDVGIFRLAFTFGMIPIFLSDIIITPLMPVLRKNIVEKNGNAAALMKLIITYLLLLDLLILGTGLVLAEPLIRVMFDVKYQSAVLPLQILLLANAIGLFFTVMISVPFMTNNLITAIKITGFAAVLCLICNGILIPFDGINGAALSLSLSYTLGTVLIILWFRRNIAIMIDWRKCVRFILACLEMMTVIIILKHFVSITGLLSLITLGSLAPLSYFIFLLLHKAITLTEIMNIFRLLKSPAELQYK